MKRMIMAALAMTLLGTAYATETDNRAPKIEPPDPSILSVPPLPLPFTAKDIEAGETRYYFHKDNVSYQTAFGDFLLCSQYALTVDLAARPKNYVPLGSDIPAPDATGNFSLKVMSNPSLGIIGGIAAAFIEEDARKAAMRLCMIYKGYKRYAISRKAYGDITRGGDTNAIAKLAIVASGPSPQGGDIGQ